MRWCRARLRARAPTGCRPTRRPRSRPRRSGASSRNPRSLGWSRSSARLPSTSSPAAPSSWTEAAASPFSRSSTWPLTRSPEMPLTAVLQSLDLLDAATVTGRMPVVLPITMQDITPYGNELFHVNSVLQPCVATDAPVVGVALTAEVAVPGSATGASHASDIEQAVRFCLEVAKAFGQGKCRFYDGGEWAEIQARYGSMKVLQTMGKGAS